MIRLGQKWVWESATCRSCPIVQLYVQSPPAELKGTQIDFYLRSSWAPLKTLICIAIPTVTVLFYTEVIIKMICCNALCPCPCLNLSIVNWAK